MPTEIVSFNRFAVDLLEAADRSMKRATYGLTDEQLYYQPTPESNSIAWLAWHLSRWKDRYGGRISGEPEVWVSQGWAAKFNMPADRTGLGDTPEQVSGFRVDRTVLFGYVEAAHQAIVERVSKLTPEQLFEPYQYMPTGDVRSAYLAFIGTAMDFTQHTGQIAYLGGIVTQKG